MLGPEHPDVATSLETYAALLEKMGRHAEADRLKDRARAIRQKRPKERCNPVCLQSYPQRLGLEHQVQIRVPVRSLALSLALRIPSSALPNILSRTIDLIQSI